MGRGYRGIRMDEGLGDGSKDAESDDMRAVQNWEDAHCRGAE